MYFTKFILCILILCLQSLEHFIVFDLFKLQEILFTWTNTGSSWVIICLGWCTGPTTNSSPIQHLELLDIYRKDILHG